MSAATAVACLSPKPTSLSTSLTGGGKEGAEITVPEGTGVKDTATLSGENAGKATGTVDYAVYSDSKCEKLVTKAGSVTVKEGKVPASEEEKLEAGAVYYWQATYLGDSLDEASKSPCGKEVLTVKAKTTLATSLSGGGKEGEEITVSEGSKVKDTATLSGTKASTATGTVDYAAYKDSSCKELASKAGEGKVEGTKAAGSEEKELEAAAVYYWQAKYLGDSLHEESTSTCTEKETVKAKTSLSATLAGQEEEEIVEGKEITVTEGFEVKDKATLSGTNASTATGTVKYSIYSDNECKELIMGAGEGADEGTKVGSSEEEELEGETTYYWQAEYGGDSLHMPSATTCGKQFVLVKTFKYRSAAYPVNLQGTNFAPKETFSFNGTFFRCNTSFTGTLNGPAESLKLKPDYAECEAYSRSGPVYSEGCEYELAKPKKKGPFVFVANVSIVCPPTKKMNFYGVPPSMVDCDVEVGPQANIAKFELLNLIGPPRWLQVRSGLLNFAYAITVVGSPECGLNVENRNDGSYVGTFELNATGGGELFIGP